MKTLTIFTPTFNRAYCLHQCYNSLLKQKSKDFLWLIIDDGSSDNTPELVQKWINEKKIGIKYHFQKNQGMHGAHNAAYSLIDTPICTCIDSDDFLADNAIEKIIALWKKAKGDETLAGMIGLDAYKNSGDLIGKKMPENLKKSTLEDLYHKYHIDGDKKIIYRTEIIKKYPPYPLFENEKFVPLGTLYLLVDKSYKLMCSNEVLCMVEYLEDGSSLNIIKQYRNNPKGFRYARQINMKYSNYFKVRFKNAIHYVSHCLILKDSKMFSSSPKPILTLFAFPMGILVYLYTLYKTRNI